MKAISKRFYNETARIEQMILLAGILGDYSFPQVVEDFFSDEDYADIEQCLGKVPKYVRQSIESHEFDAVQEWLVRGNKYGYLIRIATPIMTPTSETSASYSWGYYRTKWVYGDTLEEALEAGFSWVASMREQEKTAARGAA
jgi:hypothetical protein